MVGLAVELGLSFGGVELTSLAEAENARRWTEPVIALRAANMTGNGLKDGSKKTQECRVKLKVELHLGHEFSRLYAHV